MTELIPVVSDMQCPLHDPRAVAAVATFLADKNLTSVCAGDESDLTELGRWVKGQKGEYTGGLDKARTATRKVLRDLRVKHIVRSNHTDRMDKYLAQSAPALAELPELHYPTFMGYDDMSIEFHPKPWQFIPGWLLMHGDEGSVSKYPGWTARGLAVRTNMSVASGHTHRGAAFRNRSGGPGDRGLWSLETGNLMHPDKVSYILSRMYDWTQGFGIIVRDGSTVVPYFVPINNGRFYWDGKWWKG